MAEKNAQNHLYRWNPARGAQDFPRWGRFHTVTPRKSMKGRSPWRPLSCEASPRSSPLRTVAPAPHVPWKTFLSNVAMGPRFRGRRKAQAQRQAGEWIRVVGLAGFEDHHPHQLSGGIRKRVTLAAALISEPSILLMDEPFVPWTCRPRPPCPTSCSACGSAPSPRSSSSPTTWRRRSHWPIGWWS